MPPRRATVSAIRRPATAVMLATTTGMVVPEPSLGGQVDVEARRDLGPVRHDEDVVVGQVIAGSMPVQKPHRSGPNLFKPLLPGFARLGGYFGVVSAPQGVEALVRVVVDAPVGVRAEKIAQALRQRGGQPLGA